MSKPKTTHMTSILAALFFGAMLVSGCGGADDSGRDGDESAGAEESAGADEPVGEAEDALTKGSTSGGGGNHCGYFCPWWAKDLSDCLIIPC